MRRTIGGSLLALLLAGATVSAFPWIRDMWVGPVVLPQAGPMMTPPDGTLSVDGPRRLNRIEARDTLSNPRPASPVVLTQGRELYRIYCATCHGAAGTGDGPMAEHFRRMPDLTMGYVQNYADGWLYTIIREGGFAMPAFAASLSVDERWAVVHHVRTLDPGR